MAVTSVESASTTIASLAVSIICGSQVASGVYIWAVDMANMASVDVVQLEIRTKVYSGATSRVAYRAVYAYVQSEPIKYSIPVPVDTEIVCSIEQSAGTVRAFPWNLLKM